MPQLKLSYFDFHGGRAKPIRLALSLNAHMQRIAQTPAVAAYYAKFGVR